jgi:hypothetical protein
MHTSQNPTQAGMPGIHQEREKQKKNVHTSVTLFGACHRRSTCPARSLYRLCPPRVATSSLTLRRLDPCSTHVLPPFSPPMRHLDPLLSPHVPASSPYARRLPSIGSCAVRLPCLACAPSCTTPCVDFFL